MNVETRGALALLPKPEAAVPIIHPNKKVIQLPVLNNQATFPHVLESISIQQQSFPDNLRQIRPGVKIAPVAEPLPERDEFDDFMDNLLDEGVVSKPMDSLVDISEEKRVLGYESETVTGNVRRSTILNADSGSSDGVIYSFRQLQDYKQNNKVEFERAKRDMYMQARMAQDADGCGGRNEMGGGIEAVGITSANVIDFGQAKLGKALGMSEEHNHKSGEKAHCSKCQSHLVDGKCPQNCA